MRVTGVTFHDVEPTDVTVTVKEFDFFAVVRIKIAKTELSLFAQDAHSAQRIAMALANARFEDNTTPQELTV